jgi:hypothetical protein
MLSVKNTLVWIRMWIGSGFKKACIRIRIQFTLNPKHHIPEHALLQVRITLMRTRILLVTDADPNPEPASRFDSDPDPTFYSDSDPDLAYK